MECRKEVKDVLRCFSGSSKLVFQHFLASNVCVNPCANYGGKSSGEAGIVRMLCADTFGEMSDEERKKSLRASSGFVRMIADATKKGGVLEKDAPVAYLFWQTKFDNLLEQIEKFKEARIANPNEPIPDELDVEKVEDIEEQPRIMGVWLSYFNLLFNDSHALRLRFNLGCKKNERMPWFNKPGDFEKKKKANKQKAIRKNKREKKKKNKEQAKQDEEKIEMEDEIAEVHEQIFCGG